MSTYAFEVSSGDELDDEPGVDVVSLGGELDLTNARDLEEQLDTLQDDRPLVVDLNRVVFIDSAALHVLFKLARRRSANPPRFVLDPASGIARTLAIVGLGEVVRIASSLDELKTSPR